MDRLFPSIVAVLFAAVTFSIQPSAQADAGRRAFLGTTGNEFIIDFVDIPPRAMRLMAPPMAGCLTHTVSG